MSENITDKELLAICNLSNLKMEFANLIKQTVQSGTETIYTNHTIYSLIEKELNSINARNELKKNYPGKNKQRITDGDYENLKKIYSIQGENMAPSIKQLYEEQTELRIAEEKHEASMTEGECLGAFYNIYISRKKENIYNTKEDLQKEAPIIMEYYDRYQHGNEEGKFLNEWEVVYGGDFYEILLDYFILNKNYLEKKESNTSEGMFIITSPTAKYDFKINENFIFREDITSGKKEIYTRNLLFDVITSILPASEFVSYVNKNFSKKVIISLINSLEKLIPKGLQIKTIDENVEEKNLIEELYNLSKNGKDYISGELNITISLDIIDVKIVIVKKKSSNDFIVVFKSSGSNEIMDNLNKGVLSLDLLTFNALIENVISNYIKDSQANVYFTGYEDGAILGTSCFLMTNCTPYIEGYSNKDLGSTIVNKITYHNRAFIGAKKPNLLNLVSFNVYDIENCSPGSFAYSASFKEDVYNFITSFWNNARLTSNVGLIVPILVKKSLLVGLKEAILGVGFPVFAFLVGIHLAYAHANRKRLNDMEKGFINNNILIKKNNILMINENIFEYDYISLKSSELNNFSPKYVQLIYPDSIIVKPNSEDKLEESDTLNYKTSKEEQEFILNLCKEEVEKNKLETLNNITIKIEIDSEIRELSLPLDIAVALFSEFPNKRNYFGSRNLISFLSYILYVDDNGKFKYILIREKNILGSYPVYQENIIRPITSMEEMEIIEIFDFSAKVQEKYDENKNEIIGSNFIYFDDCNSKNNENINNIKPYNLEQGYLEQSIYQEKQIKLNNTENTKYIPIDRLEQKYLEYRDKIPYITNEISKVKGITDTQNYVYDTNLPYTEFIYFPYINNEGMINEKIREDFIGTVLRSIYREEIKYDTFDVNEDSEFNSYPLTGEVKEKNSRLNNYLIQRLKIEGKKICYPEHYNSMMELLDNDSSLIEKYYDIKVTDEHIKKAIIKFGILDKGSYDIKKIGFIYNQDKLYGRAIELVYYYNEETSLEDISTFGVCQHATLECTCGSKPGNLLVTSQNNEYSDEMLDATEEDKTTTGFGKCSITDNGCTPDLTKWEGISKGSTINGKKCLISLSTIKCKKGGLVSIKEPNCKLHNN